METPAPYVTTPDPALLDLVDKTVAAIRATDRNRWGIAELAAQVVGARVPGLTQEVARLSTMSVDSIERHAQAHVFYTWLCLAHGPSLPAALREKLTISHFWTAARLMRHYETPPGLPLEWLQHAAAEHLSAEAMAALVGETEGNANDWRPVFERWVKLAERLKTYPDIPPDLRDILRKIV